MFIITATVMWDGNEPGHVKFDSKEVNLMQNAAEAMFRYIIRDNADTEEILIDFLTGKLKMKIDTTGSYQSARIMVIDQKQGQLQVAPEALHICDVMLQAREMPQHVPAG